VVIRWNILFFGSPSNEDDSRIRNGNAPQNLATVRHIALNLLNQEKTVKAGVKRKRNKAGWDNEYLEKVLAEIFKS
jgi:SOS response regulatory protein OraA/RecX